MISQTLNHTPATSSPPPSQFGEDLIALIPHLRAFSRMLCAERTLAEDMAQEALLKAWRSQDHFVPGTNLKAWLFTILRNEFYSHMRRGKRETSWDDNLGRRIPAPADEQESALHLSDTAWALGELPERQRESLILVGVGGFSYEDAANISSIRVGTVKSRVARARAALVKILDGDKRLPRHMPARATVPSDDLLAQLSAIHAHRHI
ncbi:MAG TPA: sigma-70 family RNA polymerase sigma factor [Rhizomicrobium sp.]|nr:sigma-70 family RNA polymerase sigma factor [Rhizomicrobium sp.]